MAEQKKVHTMTTKPEESTVEIVEVKDQEQDVLDIASIIGGCVTQIIRNGPGVMTSFEKVLDEYVYALPPQERLSPKKLDILKKVMTAKGAVESLYIRLQQIY